MTDHIAPRLTRSELVRLVDNILHPKERGFSSEEITAQLNLVCVNCPDPAAAMDIMIETLAPVTAEELVNRALSYAPRDVSTVPETELSSNHPLRKMKLETN